MYDLNKEHTYRQIWVCDRTQRGLEWNKCAGEVTGTHFDHKTLINQEVF